MSKGEKKHAHGFKAEDAEEEEKRDMRNPAMRRSYSGFSVVGDEPPKAPPTRYQLACEAAKKRYKRVCKIICGWRWFAALTMILTIYALFGDDMRLLFSSKKEDVYFDAITITAMTMFSIEVVAFIGGKPEYLFGFFFWLDLLSTITLLLDVSAVGEKLFGDSISSAGSNSDGGNQGAGDSAEAARAARMSRAGTKAGRVVRLIRLLRLLKMIKVFKKEDKKELNSYPGEEVDDDEDANIQESAVSKQLSEMTTRRVIILVLTIILSLPMFRPEMYQGNLDTAGQYGMNALYRRWRDGLSSYGPENNSSAHAKYMASSDRQVYEDLFLLYLYKHNWFMDSADSPDDTSSPEDSFNRLFWLGVTPANATLGQYMLPKLTTYDWNEKWKGTGWGFFSGDVPSDIQTSLRRPWNTTRTCVVDLYKGLSLISNERDKIQCPEELRYQERAAVYPQLLTGEEASQITFMAVFDRRDGSKFEAMLNTFQTLFICLLLAVGSMTFASDANKLVLAPIERMISKLDRIRNNPLEALKIGDEEHHREQVKAARISVEEHDESISHMKKCKRFLRMVCPCCKRRLGAIEKQEPEPMETQVLERTIIKIGSLLALGFGEAGAKIISQNMKQTESSSTMGMIPGQTVDAVFAFCDIRSFTDVTEVLQDQVMIFVNRIAGIVHAVCDEFWGNPNKNVGNGFLLVWRLSEHEKPQQHKLADMAILSLTSMVAKMATAADIAEYRTHAKLLKRIPNYRIRVTFGLHLGWAIEGAIGSDFKIDASYLSPHVTMAHRLEGETTNYGAHILLSEEVVNFMTVSLAAECRLIDYIDLSGDHPIKVYTLDLDDRELQVDTFAAELATNKAAVFKARWARQKRKNDRWADDYVVHQLFESDPHIRSMRYQYTEEFFCRYQMAYLNYEAGNWPIARRLFEETRRLLPSYEDGASLALLRFLHHHDYEAPADWEGYRKFGVEAKEFMDDTLSDCDSQGSLKALDSMHLVKSFSSGSSKSQSSKPTHFTPGTCPGRDSHHGILGTRISNPGRDSHHGSLGTAISNPGRDSHHGILGTSISNPGRDSHHGILGTAISNPGRDSHHGILGTAISNPGRDSHHGILGTAISSPGRDSHHGIMGFDGLASGQSRGSDVTMMGGSRHGDEHGLLMGMGRTNSMGSNSGGGERLQQWAEASAGLETWHSERVEDAVESWGEPGMIVEDA